jgi:cation diffusion facilitator CzcD-associated flavoprotein CzcO
VGVIGTGASAVQIVPAIQPKVRRMEVFQRTAPWITPKPDRKISETEQSLFARFPFLQKAARVSQYWRREILAFGFVKEPRLLRALEPVAQYYLKRCVEDPVLRQKLTPSYRLGCKRILPTNTYYQALVKPNVEVVTEGIDAIVREGIRTKDGETHALDAIVCATGFEAAEAAAPIPLKGKGGRDLGTAWEDGAEAYLGSTVAGFPNFFMIVGPNTGLGHTSMVFMIESQIAYVLDAIRTMRAKKLATVEVRQETQDAYNREIHARLAKTVWNTGCVSWYQTRSGKNTTLWPGFTFEFRRRTRAFDEDAYEATAKETERTQATTGEAHAY